MASFQGVERRFDFKIKNDRHVVLSDYAHHPEEIRQSILSLREVFDGRKLTAIFQPHLYSRTHDFYMEFAESLSLLDEAVLTEIYPARELPIEGVSSKLIYDNLAEGVEKYIIKKDTVLDFVKSHPTDVLVILGAGDLDDYTQRIADIIKTDI
jgi:UDP-N-acetylmuramate--alanine ligase